MTFDYIRGIIREEKERQGWKTADLAEKAGVSETFYYNLTQKHTQRTDMFALECLLTALGLELSVKRIDK